MCRSQKRVSGVKGPVSAQDTPRLSSQDRGDLFDLEGQRVGNKRQKQEMRMRERGERSKGEGEGYLSQRVGLWVERGQTWPRGKWQFIKVQGGSPVLG